MSITELTIFFTLLGYLSSMFPDVYPFFEEIEVFESPPPNYQYNSHNRPKPYGGLLFVLLPSFVSFTINLFKDLLILYLLLPRR